MPSILQVLIALVLRRHPSSDILQICADRQLDSIAGRLTQLHVRGCESCQQEMRSSTEILDLLRMGDVASRDVSVVRERIFEAIAARSMKQQVAINDVRRLLGHRAADRVKDGTVRSDVRTELAAFLGNRAADSFVQRMSA